jgi:hypothetical protein
MMQGCGVTDYSCAIERVLSGCVITWDGEYKAPDPKALQRVVSTAQYITGARSAAIQDLYTRRCRRKDQNMVRLYPPKP